MTKYESDIIAWSKEQAALIRSRRFGELDIENIASELESLISDEQIHFTELLANCLELVVLRTLETGKYDHLSRLIVLRRKQVLREFEACPSLVKYTDELFELAWGDAVVKVCKALEGTAQEWKLDGLEEECPWRFEQVMREGF